MPKELHVRNLPDEVYEELTRQAKAEGRSVSSQAGVLLRLALRDGPDLARRRAAIGKMRELQGRLPATPPDFPLAEELIREDRESR